METWITTLITILCSCIASSGFWAFIQKIQEKKSSSAKMLLGLGHDRIIWLGMQYIKRGKITKEEYENLYRYLYLPYLELGGNGTAKRVMEEVGRLPLETDTI